MSDDRSMKRPGEGSATAGRERDRRSGANQSRRRFTMAGLATPVLMTLASKPAWANNCSLSGHMSANVSNIEHECTFGVGCTPGFWGQNLAPWDLPWMDRFSYGRCVATNPAGRCMAIDGSEGTLFVTIFTKDPLVSGATTLIEILRMGEGVQGQGQSPGNIDFHVIAAVLNANAFEGYGATEEQIVDAYLEARDAGDARLEELATVLDNMNNRGCPLNAHGDCKETVNVDLNGDGYCDLCNVPTALDNEGRCIAVITREILDDPYYQCPPNTECDD